MSKFQIEFTVRAQVTQLRAADLRFTVTVAVQNIERLLKQQEHNSPSANTEILWGLVTAFKGMQARQRGEVSEAIALIEQALRQLPQEASWLRATIVLNLGVTYFVADNFAPAQGVLAEVSKIGQTKGH